MENSTHSNICVQKTYSKYNRNKIFKRKKHNKYIKYYQKVLKDTGLKQSFQKWSIGWIYEQWSFI